MSTITSNAFNFLDMISAGVDPRTGSFTAGVSLVNFVSHKTSGLSVALSLNYSPMNTEDQGFGQGWSLPLSRFDENTSTLSLGTGQAFKIELKDDSNEYLMPYRRLKDVRVFAVQAGEGHGELLKVVSKDGVHEFIDRESGTLLRRVTAQGLSLHLEHERHQGVYRIARIFDGEGREVVFDMQSPYTTVVTDLFNGTPVQRIVIEKKGDNAGVFLDRVEFETKDCAAFFEYQYDSGSRLRLLTAVTHPSGLVDSVRYTGPSASHGLPAGAPLPYIPYVYEHITQPGASQEERVVEYAFSDRNYLGFAGEMAWMDGADSLFMAERDYRYESTEIINGTIQIARSYNKYHLLEDISHSLLKGDDEHLWKRTDYDYYADLDAGIEEQPATYSLLRGETTTHHDIETGEVRAFHHAYRYDEFGNLEEYRGPDGSTEIHEYYPPAGEEGSCPPEPNGMKTLRKRSIFRPPVTGHSLPERTVAMTYMAAARADDSDTPMVLLKEQVSSQGVSQHYTWWPQTDSLSCGRMKSVTRLFNGHESVQSFAYTFTEGYLTTTTTQLSHDGISVQTQQDTGYLHGQPDRLLDAQDVVTLLDFDVSGRLSRIDASPDTPHHAYARFTYTRDDISGIQALTREDSLGNLICSEFNAAGKMIRQSVSDDDAVMRLTTVNHYDAFGMLVRQDCYDWYGRLKMAPLVLTTRMEYDHYGNIRTTYHPDGKTERYQQSIAGLSSIYTLDGLYQETTLYYPDGQVRHKITRDNDGNILAETGYMYDGYDRTVMTHDTDGHITTYRYDDVDRLTETLRDIAGTPVILRTAYADFTPDALATDIRLNDISLGSRRYDGLGRLLQEFSGTSSVQYDYAGASPLPQTQVTANGNTLRYDNNIILNQVKGMTVDNHPDLSTEYRLDDLTGALLSSINQHVRTDCHYNRTGKLTSEQVTLADGITREVRYQYTLQGRLMQQQDADGRTTHYSYDPLGRLSQCRQQLPDDNLLVTDVHYDTFSRLTGCDVYQGDDHITVDLTLNVLGLETQRDMGLNGESLFSITQTYDNRLQLETRTRTTPTGTLQESFAYDEWHRLSVYTCSGDMRPCDRYGNAILSQTFTYDQYSNTTRVVSQFADGTSNQTDFTFDEQDPVQLVSMASTHPQYPSHTFSYDAAGNQLSDELGRQFTYNALHQLTQAEVNPGMSATYDYDATGAMVARHWQDDTCLLYYAGGELVSEITPQMRSRYHQTGAGHYRLVSSETESVTQWLLPDAAGSIVATLESSVSGIRNTTYRQYSPYGEEHTGPWDNELLRAPPGFNGEWQDSVTGLYPLGRGYRFYSPGMMRFNARDSLSPFSEMHAYAYCLGDPVNQKDPSGHFIITLLVSSLVGMAVGATVAAVGEGIQSSVAGDEFDWKQVGIGAALGLISGVFGAAASGAKTSVQVGLAVTDAVVSGAADFGLNVAAGVPVKEAGRNAALGAVIGLTGFGAGVGIGKAGKSLSAANQRITPGVRNGFTGGAGTGNVNRAYATRGGWGPFTGLKGGGEVKSSKVHEARARQDLRSADAMEQSLARGEETLRNMDNTLAAVRQELEIVDADYSNAIANINAIGGGGQTLNANMQAAVDLRRTINFLESTRPHVEQSVRILRGNVESNNTALRERWVVRPR